MLGKAMSFIKSNSLKKSVKRHGIQNIEGERNHGVAPQRKNSCHGKTYLRLKEASSAANAHELLVSIGEDLKADSKARKIRIHHISSFLRWATSSQSDFILSSVSRTPPSKFSLSQYIGRKPKGIKIKFPHQKLH